MPSCTMCGYKRSSPSPCSPLGWRTQQPPVGSKNTLFWVINAINTNSNSVQSMSTVCLYERIRALLGSHPLFARCLHLCLMTFAEVFLHLNPTQPGFLLPTHTCTIRTLVLGPRCRRSCPTRFRRLLSSPAPTGVGPTATRVCVRWATLEGTQALSTLGRVFRPVATVS